MHIADSVFNMRLILSTVIALILSGCANWDEFMRFANHPVWNTIGDAADSVAAGVIAGDQAARSGASVASSAAPSIDQRPIYGTNAVLVSSQPIRTSFGTPAWRCVYSVQGRTVGVTRDTCPNQIDIR